MDVVSVFFVFTIDFEPVEDDLAYLYRQNAAVPSLEVQARYLCPSPPMYEEKLIPVKVPV